VKIHAWHASGSRFRRFNPRRSAMGGIIWFTEDLDQILRGEIGGLEGSKYVYEVTLDVDRAAGWDEYEKLALAQVRSMGFDGIHLDEHWVMFDPARIAILKVHKLADLRRKLT